MSKIKNKIKLFENKKVRTIWDEDAEKWWFSIIDIVEILTNSENPRRYWSDLKRKLKTEGSQLYENIVQLKFQLLNSQLVLMRVQEWLNAGQIQPKLLVKNWNQKQVNLPFQV